MREREKAARKANREGQAAACRKYRVANAALVAKRAAAYQKEHPEKHAAKEAKRRAAKLRATPAWSNLDLVSAFYVLADCFTKSTGIPHHVDHIEPLRGKHVCGLHNEFNLQVLPAKVNIAKGNRPSEVRGYR